MDDDDGIEAVLLPFLDFVLKFSFEMLTCRATNPKPLFVHYLCVRGWGKKEWGLSADVIGRT